MTSPVRDVRGLADDLLFPDAMRVDGLDVLPVAHLDALAALGLYGAPVPVQAGGLGLDLAAYCAVVEDLASGCLATTFVWLQHRGLVMTLAADGTPAALRDRWLGPACRGQVRGGIALGGLMPGPPRLRARPDRGGWRLDGDAPWVTGWGLIDLLLVVARGPDDSVVSLIMDATARPGLTVTRERLAAVHASVTVRLGFDGDSPAGGRLDVTIRIASADMASADINKAIAGPEWFDVARHPLAEFHATEIRRAPAGSPPGRFVARGTLALKGVTQPLEVPLAWTAAAGGATLDGEFSVKRSLFGIGTGEWAATSVIGADVSVKFHVQLREVR